MLEDPDTRVGGSQINANRSLLCHIATIKNATSETLTIRTKLLKI